MKAANHRSQHLTASSIGLAEYEQPLPEQIYCPHIDNPLPRSSCEERQKRNDMPMCKPDADGNCRARRPKRPTITDEQRAKSTAKNKGRGAGVKAQEKAELICALFQEGVAIKTIARIAKCGKQTIYNRLAEAGIKYRQKAPSKRQQILAWLDQNPYSTLEQTRAAWDSPRSTIDTYYFDWIKNGGRAQALKQQEERP